MRGDLNYITSAAFGNTLRALTIDKTNNLLFVVRENIANHIYSYTYDSDGNITSADVINAVDTISEDITVDETNRVLFLCNQNEGLISYLYTSAGIMTSADRDTINISEAKATDIDSLNNVLFLAYTRVDNSGYVRSYTYDTSAGTLTSATDQMITSAVPVYDIAVDPTYNGAEDQSGILLITNYNSGLWTYTYTSAGAITSADHETYNNNYLYGLAINKQWHLAFISDYNKPGIISQKYSIINGSLSTSSDFKTIGGGNTTTISLSPSHKLIHLCSSNAGLFTFGYNKSYGLQYLNNLDFGTNVIYDVVTDDANKLIFIAYGNLGLLVYSFDWTTNIYANILSSYTTSGDGTSALPLNMSQLSAFANGTSANAAFITDGDTIKIKGSYESSAGENFEIFNNIDASINITSWENCAPWRLSHLSAVGTSGYCIINTNSSLSADNLVIENAIIKKPFISNNLIDADMDFNNCIFCKEVKCKLISGSTPDIDFNGCSFTSADTDIETYTPPS